MLLRSWTSRYQRCGPLLPRPRGELRIDDGRGPNVRDEPRSLRFQPHDVLRLPDGASPRGRDALLPSCDALLTALTYSLP
jgi:hypothetical protein